MNRARALLMLGFQADQTPSLKEIKEAYHVKALTYHPDEPIVSPYAPMFFPLTDKYKEEVKAKRHKKLLKLSEAYKFLCKDLEKEFDPVDRKISQYPQYILSTAKFYIKMKLRSIGRKMSESPIFTLSAIAAFVTFLFFSMTNPAGVATNLALSIFTGGAVCAVHTIQLLWQRAHFAIFSRRLRVQNSLAQESIPSDSNQPANGLHEKPSIAKLDKNLKETIMELEQVQDNNKLDIGVIYDLNTKFIAFIRRLMETNDQLESENAKLRSENEKLKETVQSSILASDIMDEQTDADINVISDFEPQEIFDVAQPQIIATSYEEKSQKRSPRPN